MGKLAACLPVLTLLCASWQSAEGNKGYLYAGNVKWFESYAKPKGLWLNRQQHKQTPIKLQTSHIVYRYYAT